MFSHTEIVLGWVSSGAVLLSFLGLLGVVGWILFRKNP